MQRPGQKEQAHCADVSPLRSQSICVAQQDSLLGMQNTWLCLCINTIYMFTPKAKHSERSDSYNVRDHCSATHFLDVHFLGSCPVSEIVVGERKVAEVCSSEDIGIHEWSEWRIRGCEDARMRDGSVDHSPSVQLQPHPTTPSPSTFHAEPGQRQPLSLST